MNLNQLFPLNRETKKRAHYVPNAELQAVLQETPIGYKALTPMAAYIMDKLASLDRVNDAPIAIPETPPAPPKSTPEADYRHMTPTETTPWKSSNRRNMKRI